MLKRTAIIVALVLLLVNKPVFSQDRVDLLVAIDSSRSMFTYYNQVIDYVLSSLVKEYLRAGDGFHVLTFSDKTQIEIAQVLKTESDLKSVIARLYLLYPLGKSTDLVSALKNVYRYVADLPENSIKYIILITDGMHAPGEESQYASLSPSEVMTELQSSAAQIREKGWNFKILRVPFDSEDQNGKENSAVQYEKSKLEQNIFSSSGFSSEGDYLDKLAASSGSDILVFDPAKKDSLLSDTINLPSINFQSNLGNKPYRFTLSADVQNRSSKEISVELKNLLLDDGVDILEKKVFSKIQAGKTESIKMAIKLPSSLKEGPLTLIVEPRFADNIRVSPAKSTITFNLKQSLFSSIMHKLGIAGLYILLLLLALLLVSVIILYIKRVDRRSKEPLLGAFVDASSSIEDKTPASQSLQKASAVALSSTTALNTDTRKLKSTYSQAAFTKTEHKALYGAEDQKQKDHISASQSKTLLTDYKQTMKKEGVSALASAVNDKGKQDPGTTFADYRASRHIHEVPSVKANALKDEAQSRKAIQYSPTIKKSSSIRIVLKVQWQNPHIGKRNIKTMHAGGKATVGGGNSDFLIFLYPLPKDLGIAYFDGEDITFVPTKLEYFPDYNDAIEACLGKPVRILSPRGKELFMTFEKYEAPEVKLNRLLSSIKIPGLHDLATGISDVIDDSGD